MSDQVAWGVLATFVALCAGGVVWVRRIDRDTAKIARQQRAEELDQVTRIRDAQDHCVVTAAEIVYIEEARRLVSQGHVTPARIAEFGDQS